MTELAATLEGRPAGRMKSRQSWGTVLRSVLYYAKPAALIFLATLVLGVALALLLPAKYRSEARLLTLPADYYAVPDRSRNAGGPAEAFKPEELAQVEMQLLSSQDLQRDVLVRSGVAADDPLALEKARKAFAKALSIQRVEGANVIELSYQGRTPQEAAERLQTLLDTYFEARARVLTSGRADMIAREREAASQQLIARDAALKDFQQRNGIADIAEQVGGAVAVDTALRRDLAATRASLSETRGNVTQLRRTTASVPVTVELFRDDTEATKAIAEMQGQLLTLEAKRADLQGRYMAGSPLIEQVDKQIASLRSTIDQKSGQLKEARRTGRNSVYDAATDRLLANDAQASGHSAKLESLRTELSASEQRLRSLNEVSAVIARLRTDRDAAEQRFRALTTQLEEARARELEARTGSTNVRVIQRPSLPDSRSNAPVALIAGSIVAGLALAGAALFVLILRRENLLDPHEVNESLDLPVLLDLTTPTIINGPNKLRLLRLVDRAPSVPRRGRVIALVSTEPGAYDNKLAGLVHLLEAHGTREIASVSFEESAYGQATDPALHHISDWPGRTRIRVGTLAWSIDQTGERLLSSLRASSDFTIVLVPPVSARTIEDAREMPQIEMAAAADDVLLVVRAEVTQRSAAESLVAALREREVPVRGVILVGRRIAWPKAVRAFD